MARKFEGIREGMSPDRRARNEAAALLLSVSMDLVELREAKDITQEALAEKLDIAQSNVSRLERRADMLVSTLSEVVRALGGELQLIATFPDGAVRIKQFEVHGKVA